MNQINVVLESLKTFWMELGNFLPQLIAALLVLIVGWLIAKLIRKAFVRVLRLLRVDVAAEKSGIENFLLRGGVQFTTVTILGSLIYWLILFMVLFAALNILGLQAAADIFNKIIVYIPNVIVAIVVLIFGTMFAKFIQGISLTYLSNVGFEGAQLVSYLAQYAIVIFVVSIALEQLAIGGQVLVSAFQIAFGGLCLALALAFGLGGREWAARILEKMWKKSA
jgi:hypothetical protein